jgi:HAD superfamily hydrolase (TIGR01549 family)
VLRVLLLDLDDTLLANSMPRFIPAYFEALCGALSQWAEPDRLIGELLAGTRAMDAGDGTGPTNTEAFAAVFYPRLGVSRDQLEPEILRFYERDFPKLRPLTTTVDGARDLVDSARARGLRLVVATNPLFPRQAIEERIRWAGFDPDDGTFELVTCADDMHATKASPAYYREILDRIGEPPEACLMVGDDWGWDVVQPARVGIRSWWVAPDGVQPPDDRARPVGRGDLRAFHRWLKETLASG